MDDDEEEMVGMRALRASEKRSGAGVSVKRRNCSSDEEKEVVEAEKNEEEELRPKQRPMARRFDINFDDVPTRARVDDDDGEGELRTLLPSSFGGDGDYDNVSDDDDDDDDGSRRRVNGAPSGHSLLPTSDTAHRGAEEEEELEEQEEEEEGEDRDGKTKALDEWSHLPIHRECRLKGHSRAVSCVDVEHSGSRVASGGHDGKLLLYDFGGMKSDLRAFRSLSPCGAHHIRGVSWSPSGDLLLVAPSSACASIVSRDGAMRGEFIKGDMYIRDMKNTKGHVAALTGGQWSRNDRAKLATCSEDASVRIWDASNFGSQLSVLKASKASGAGGFAAGSRQSVECCSWSADDRMIAGGMSDGTVQLWDAGASRSAAIGVVGAPRQQMVKRQDWSFAPSPKTVIRNAFTAGHAGASDDVAVTGVCWYSSTLVAARSLNGSVKLWDIRMTTTSPLAANEGLPLSAGGVYIESATLCFSPDGTMLLTPTLLQPPPPHAAAGAHRGGGGNVPGSPRPEAALAFLDRTTLEIVQHVGYGAGSGAGADEGDSTVSCCCWNANINQIFVGGGTTSRVSKSDDDGAGGSRMRYEGFTSVLFSEEFSTRGALLSTARAAKTRDISDLALLANYNNNLTSSVRVQERPTHTQRRRAGGGASSVGGALSLKKRKLDAAAPMKQSLSGRGVHGQAGATSTTLLRMKMFGKNQSKTHDSSQQHHPHHPR